MPLFDTGGLGIIRRTANFASPAKIGPTRSRRRRSVRRAVAHRLGNDLDRFEQADHDFHERVRNAYLHMAAQAPDVWVVLDARLAVEELSEAVASAVEERLRR